MIPCYRTWQQRSKTEQKGREGETGRSGGHTGAPWGPGRPCPDPNCFRCHPPPAPPPNPHPLRWTPAAGCLTLTLHLMQLPPLLPLQPPRLQLPPGPGCCWLQLPAEEGSARHGSTPGDTCGCAQLNDCRTIWGQTVSADNGRNSCTRGCHSTARRPLSVKVQSAGGGPSIVALSQPAACCSVARRA